MNLTESIKNVMIEGTLKWETSREDTGAQEAKLQDGSKFTLKNVAGNLIVSFVPSGGTKGNQIFKTPTGQPLAFMKAKQAAENFIGAQGKNPNQSSANESESEVKEGAKTVLEWKPVDAIPGQEEASTDQGRYILFQHGLFWCVNFSPKGKERGVAKQIGKVNAQSSNAIAKAKQIAQSHANGENEELSHDRDWGTKTLTQQNKEVTPGQTNEQLIPIKDLIKKESLEKACWKGYKAIGTKEKDGKTVPNCVPEAIGQSGMDVNTLATMVTLKPSDKLTVKYGSVLVNDRPFEMTDPDESQDWPKSVTPEGKLITWFKGRQSQANEWSPEEITGYYTDELMKTESTQVSEKHVRMIQLIAEESNRTLIEKFLAENTIIGHETELSAIRADFKRFKKLHSHK